MDNSLYQTHHLYFSQYVEYEDDGSTINLPGPFRTESIRSRPGFVIGETESTLGVFQDCTWRSRHIYKRIPIHHTKNFIPNDPKTYDK